MQSEPQPRARARGRGAAEAHRAALALATHAAAAASAGARSHLARCAAAEETVAAAAATGDARPAAAALAAAACAAAGLADAARRAEEAVWGVVGPVAGRRVGLMDLDDALLGRVLDEARLAGEGEGTGEGVEGEVATPGVAFMALAGVNTRCRRIMYGAVTALRLRGDADIPRIGCVVAACPRLRRVEFGAALSAAGAAAATVALFSAVGARPGRDSELLLSCDSSAAGKAGIYQQIRDALDPFLCLLRARAAPVALYDANKQWGKLMLGGADARIFEMRALRDLYVRDSRLAAPARGGSLPARLRVLTLDRCEVGRAFLASVHRAGAKGDDQVRIRLFGTTLVDGQGADQIEDNKDYAALACGTIVQSKQFDQLALAEEAAAVGSGRSVRLGFGPGDAMRQG